MDGEGTSSASSSAKALGCKASAIGLLMLVLEASEKMGGACRCPSEAGTQSEDQEGAMFSQRRDDLQDMYPHAMH